MPLTEGVFLLHFPLLSSGLLLIGAGLLCVSGLRDETSVLSVPAPLQSGSQTLL